MPPIKHLALPAVLTTLLAACASTQPLEDQSGTNLVDTTQPIYTLVNLHPDQQRKRLYTVNYQQDGLIPRCTQVDLQDYSNKSITFKETKTDTVYTLIRHKSSPDFAKYLQGYFGTECTATNNLTLSSLDKKGIGQGKALTGMTKEGVTLAIGFPPEHTTPSLKNNEWMYWSNRWNKFIVIFNDKGLVERIQD
ncbi:hypothetical protein [Vibrio rumoiensis]|uniref:Lipoprotein SmpA/OmlA domain-containing protein n=1 Tax=Vibrio rumoiensis 1S-45 TaxID=1188252 RepID=A0A1E5E4Q6_9VIBR|nr:hypothetical protein [Vibrio rumoiensis]OEF28109.1 hypothetical protein A1QC_05560 [Vibrio rumoiensis 1S-45]